MLECVKEYVQTGMGTIRGREKFVYSILEIFFMSREDVKNPNLILKKMKS